MISNDPEDLAKLYVSYTEVRKQQKAREYKAYGWWSVLWAYFFDENRVYVGNVKVFKLNDCDWVAACTLQEAIEWYCAETTMEPDEAVDDPHECPLTETMKVDDGEHYWWEDGAKDMTFRDAIRAHAQKGYNFPVIIASTEY